MAMHGFTVLAASALPNPAKRPSRNRSNNPVRAATFTAKRLRRAKLGSGAIRIPVGVGFDGIFEDRHCGCHAAETEPLVESFLARHCIKDDLLVSGREPHQARDDLLA